MTNFKLLKLSLMLLSLMGLVLLIPRGTIESVQAQTFTCDGVTEIQPSECQALVALYNRTNGNTWRNNGGWLTTPMPCSWRGITCAGGHVNQLDLNGNNLSGNIPQELGNLIYLERLYLYGNQLSGNVPPLLGNLANLRFLGLSNNALGGALPDSLRNLTNLGAGSFWFDNTNLCEPSDLFFQRWLSRIGDLRRTWKYCTPPIPTPAPTSTPSHVIVSSGWQCSNCDPVQKAESSIPLANVIRNGDFELWSNGNEVATYWQPFSNGNAHFGWYNELWREAIHSGSHAQEMEIEREDWGVNYRVIAINQTVDVRPNFTYTLTIHVMMRSNTAFDQRNRGDYAMDWGISYAGPSDYNAVELNGTGWFNINLPEQARLGSLSPTALDAKLLTYSQVRAFIYTGSQKKITLFIRGVKKDASEGEANFNVDDVSLIGSSPYLEAVPRPTGAIREGECKNCPPKK